MFFVDAYGVTAYIPWSIWGLYEDAYFWASQGMRLPHEEAVSFATWLAFRYAPPGVAARCGSHSLEYVIFKRAAS